MLNPCFESVMSPIAWRVGILLLLANISSRSVEPLAHSPVDTTLSNGVVRLPAVTVTATNHLKEDFLFGDNLQPEWTTRRRFTTTRLYVHPPWQIETELGLDVTLPRSGKAGHL